jgi:hypothetical protein
MTAGDIKTVVTVVVVLLLLGGLAAFACRFEEYQERLKQAEELKKEANRERKS